MIGDATESAILRSMERLLGNVEHYRLKNPKVCEVPFNSTDKFQVSIHKNKSNEGDSNFLLAMKVLSSSL